MAESALKILFFGDGVWASKSLLRLRADGDSLVGVVLRRRPSSPDLEDAARSLGLEVLRPDDVNATEFVERVRALTPDLNLSVSYDQILREPVRSAARHGFVNLHAGKLPAYRGRNVVNWAILNGETEIGVTAHFVDDGIDTGDILLQRTLPIGWTDTYGDVLGRVVEAFPDLAADTVALIRTGKAERRPQSAGAGTYFGGRREGDEWLDWTKPSAELHNKVRGISRPGPGARTLLDGRPVTVWRAFHDPGWPKYVSTPGEVVERDANEGVFVKTGDGKLLLQEVQVEDGPCEKPRWRIGVRLGPGPDAILSVLARLEALERKSREGEIHG